MAFGKGFWAATWVVSGVLEVIFAPASVIAWVFLAVSVVYLFLKMFEGFLSEGLGLVLTGLTALLWVLSIFTI